MDIFLQYTLISLFLTVAIMIIITAVFGWQVYRSAKIAFGTPDAVFDQI